MNLDCRTFDSPGALSDALGRLTPDKRPAIVVPGGMTAQLLYEYWGQNGTPFSADSRFFISDERLSPHFSYYPALAKVWLAKQPHTEFHTLPLTSTPLKEYQVMLLALVPQCRFDLSIVSLGSHGRIAGLFADSAQLSSPALLLETDPPPDLVPQVKRVTLGLAAFNRARELVLLATPQLTREFLQHAPGKRDLHYPASLLDPPNQLLHVFTINF